MASKKEREQSARRLQTQLVLDGYLPQTCLYCNCLIDGSVFHDCNEGKVKHLCLRLTRPQKDDEDA